MKEDYQGLTKVLNERDNFLVSTHINPDGDAIGSLLAMGWILEKIGKKAHLIIQDPVPYKLKILGGSEKIISMDQKISVVPQPEVLICLDAPNVSRIGQVADLTKQDIVTINVDHHESNDNFGNVNIVDHQACSTTEIIFQIAELFGLKLDREVAEQIYTGILIDTGRFRFSNTTPKAFEISAKLLSAGARPDFLAEWLFHTSSLATTKGLRELLNTMELFIDDKVAISVFSNDFLNGLKKEGMETEGFVNFTLSIESVQVSALLQETESGDVRGSLRSKTDKVNVNKIANAFGGGGHARAAGFKCKSSVSEVTKKLVTAVQELI